MLEVATDEDLFVLAERTAWGQGRPVGEVWEDLRRDRDQKAAQRALRPATQKARAHAAQESANNAPPVNYAAKPFVPDTGPRDAEEYGRRVQWALCAYSAMGEVRMSCDVVAKHPEYYRWGVWAWRDPDAALRKFPRWVRMQLELLKGQGGWCTYGRGVVALQYVIFRLSRRTNRSGVTLLAGCSGGFLGACIPSADPRRKTLCATTILNRKHNGAAGVPGTEGPRDGLAGDVLRHDCGYIEALCQLGLVFAWQPPADDVPLWQVGRRGHACLQVLLPDSVWRAPSSEPPS